MPKLFTYGTLREPGVEATHVLWDFKMLDFGQYPGITEAGAGGVKGNIVNVTEKELKKLDLYERCDIGLFKRVEARAYTLNSGMGTECYVYVCGNILPPTIQSGDWFKK